MTMQFNNLTPEMVEAEFLRVKVEIEGFVGTLVSELKKPFPQRSDTAIAPLRQRSAQLTREVSVLANGAGQAIAGVLRADAEVEGFAPQQDARVRVLQDIQSSALYWRSRFEPVMACVERQISGAPVPLYEPEPEPDSVRRTIYDVLDRTAVGLDYVVNPNEQSEVTREMGCFPDIRMRHSIFAQHALAAYRVALVRGLYNRAAFLDVGCGGGGKVLMASQFFERADGLELDPAYVRAAEHLIAETELPNSHIYEGNALTYEGYGDYDIVYFYQPMRNTEKLMELERAIVENVRPGTILIAPYLPFRSRALDLGCGHVVGDVFLSATSNDEAEAVRREAEQTGVRVILEVASGAWGEVWLPVLQAFAANGFGLR